MDIDRIQITHVSSKHGCVRRWVHRSTADRDLFPHRLVTILPTAPPSRRPGVHLTQSWASITLSAQASAVEKRPETSPWNGANTLVIQAVRDGRRKTFVIVTKGKSMFVSSSKINYTVGGTISCSKLSSWMSESKPPGVWTAFHSSGRRSS